MPAAKPYYTSNDLIESVKRKISVPIAQNTYSIYDILAFANEEMFIAQVPSMLQFHEEYFVYEMDVPLEQNKTRYAIPDRAIGMKLRDLFWRDENDNLYEMVRISSEDKAFFQRNISINEALAKFYLENNEIVLTPTISSGVTGKLAMYIYLRPNQLVPDERAATIKSFTKNITLTASQINPGDFININQQIFTAVASSPGPFQFVIGPSDSQTAINFTNAINTAGVAYTSVIANPSSSQVVIKFLTLQNLFISASSQVGIVPDFNTTGIEFNNIPTTYLNTTTKLYEPLFGPGIVIDLLQTKPGHRTYNFDITIPVNGINGNIINFNVQDVLTTMVVGDYMCLANECIIPQIPPDLHNLLAERTSARILASLGDAAGLQASNQKIQEMELRQGNLVDNRVDGSVMKVNGRHSVLRFQSIGSRRRT